MFLEPNKIKEPFKITLQNGKLTFFSTEVLMILCIRKTLRMLCLFLFSKSFLECLKYLFLKDVLENRKDSMKFLILRMFKEPLVFK